MQKQAFRPSLSADHHVQSIVSDLCLGLQVAVWIQPPCCERQGITNCNHPGENILPCVPSKPLVPLREYMLPSYRYLCHGKKFTAVCAPHNCVRVHWVFTLSSPLQGKQTNPTRLISTEVPFPATPRWTSSAISPNHRILATRWRPKPRTEFWCDLISLSLAVTSFRGKLLYMFFR